LYAPPKGENEEVRGPELGEKGSEPNVDLTGGEFLYELAYFMLEQYTFGDGSLVSEWLVSDLILEEMLYPLIEVLTPAEYAMMHLCGPLYMIFATAMSEDVYNDYTQRANVISQEMGGKCSVWTGVNTDLLRSSIAITDQAMQAINETEAEQQFKDQGDSGMDTLLKTAGAFAAIGLITLGVGMLTTMVFGSSIFAGILGTSAVLVSCQAAVVTSIAGIVCAAAGIAALTVRAGKIESAVLDAEGNIAQLTQKATGLESLVQSAQGDISQIQQAAGEISLSVTEQAGADGAVSAKITLKIGPNSYSGYIRLTGNVDVSGQLSAQALYAARGDIAALTVDSLSTSRRIAKFLAGDTTDDNYIRIREQTVDFVSGVYAGGRLQAATPEGMPLYWEDEVYESTEVTLGEDGYPSKNGGRIFTTTAVTDYPVYVYRYAELIKQSLCFGVDTLTGDYAPIGIFGAGDESGANRGYILKRRTGFDLRYLPPAGEEIGIHMGADGYMDLAGLRRTTKLDLSRWDEGVFTETVEGGETVTYAVIFEEMAGERMPVKITDGTGHETAICWKEGS
jgi:hypothetical protein